MKVLLSWRVEFLSCASIHEFVDEINASDPLSMAPIDRQVLYNDDFTRVKVRQSKRARFVLFGSSKGHNFRRVMTESGPPCVT